MMPCQLLVALAAAAAASRATDEPPPPHLRPKKPYRAWAFHAADHTTPAGLWQNLPPSLYPGANLDVTPGGNISALQEENDRG